MHSAEPSKSDDSSPTPPEFPRFRRSLFGYRRKSVDRYVSDLLERYEADGSAKHKRKEADQVLRSARVEASKLLLDAEREARERSKVVLEESQRRLDELTARESALVRDLPKPEVVDAPLEADASTIDLVKQSESPLSALVSSVVEESILGQREMREPTR